HLGVARLVLVLRRRRRGNDRGVHDGALRQLHAVLLEVLIHRGEQRLGQTVLSSGAPSWPRSIPTNRRIAAESYSASSTAGSDSAYHCCRKWMRSIRSSPTGRRPPPTGSFG